MAHADDTSIAYVGAVNILHALGFHGKDVARKRLLIQGSNDMGHRYGVVSRFTCKVCGRIWEEVETFYMRPEGFDSEGRELGFFDRYKIMRQSELGEISEVPVDFFPRSFTSQEWKNPEEFQKFLDEYFYASTAIYWLEER